MEQKDLGIRARVFEENTLIDRSLATFQSYNPLVSDLIESSCTHDALNYISLVNLSESIGHIVGRLYPPDIFHLPLIIRLPEGLGVDHQAFLCGCS